MKGTRIDAFKIFILKTVLVSGALCRAAGWWLLPQNKRQTKVRQSLLSPVAAKSGFTPNSNTEKTVDRFHKARQFLCSPMRISRIIQLTMSSGIAKNYSELQNPAESQATIESSESVAGQTRDWWIPKYYWFSTCSTPETSNEMKTRVCGLALYNWRSIKI